MHPCSCVLQWCWLGSACDLHPGIEMCPWRLPGCQENCHLSSLTPHLFFSLGFLIHLPTTDTICQGCLAPCRAASAGPGRSALQCKLLSAFTLPAQKDALGYNHTSICRAPVEFILIRCRSFQGHLSFTGAKLLLCLLPGEHRKAEQVGSHGTGTATVPRGNQNCAPEDAPCCAMAAAASLCGTSLGMEPASSCGQKETLT